jgi:hypothetical protein
MIPDDFRRIALSMPGAEELNGMGYANFRADRKTFATFEDSKAVIRLTHDQQATFVATAAEVFAPASGGWGRLGSTIVRLEVASEAMLQLALATAWGNVTHIAAAGIKVAADVSVTAVDDAPDGVNVAADIANLPDVVNTVDAANVPEVLDPSDAASAEPRDDLQSAIDRLQEYWGTGPGRGLAT